jgi:aspartate aminotransferase
LGIAELRKAICEKLKNDNYVTYTPNQICVGTGAKQPLVDAVPALYEEGDEVIVPTAGSAI